MPPEGTPWIAVVQRVIEGDPVAFAQLARLVTASLRRCRAYDFESEWDDLVQEVVVQAVRMVQEGRIDEPGRLVVFVRTVTRNKVVDRIRRFQRRDAREVAEEGTPLTSETEPETARLDAMDVQDALRQLPDKQRLVVLAVYAEGRTYDEAAERSGIPLGSLKRYLRQGLSALHESLQGNRDAP